MGERRESVSRAAKQRIVRTPLEGPLRAVQLAGHRRRGRREPELARLHAEHEAILAAFARLVSPGSHCVDVGAHVGSMLSALCRLAPEGRHLAVEADPAKATWLRRRFPEVEVANVAVDESPGRVSFGRDPRRSGYSRVVAAHDVPAARSQGLDLVDVAAARLDDVVDGRRVDVVKIDVEGHELPCLRGATRLLANDRPRLVIEAGFVPGDPEDSDLPALHRHVTDAGYRWWTVLGFVEGARSLGLGAFLDTHRWPFEAWNFVALPEEDPLVRTAGAA